MGKDGRGVIVVTDTSVVLNLAWLREERLLSELFGSVLAPPVVRAEFERLTLADHRFHGLRFPESVTIAAPVATVLMMAWNFLASRWALVRAPAPVSSSSSP